MLISLLKSCKPLFIMFVFFLSIGKLNASHLMGSDIFYRQTGQWTYHITYKIYRDCRGIPLPAPKFTVYSQNNTNGIPLIVVRTSIRDISNICSKDSAPCRPANTATMRFGVEEHIYETVIDFSDSKYANLVANNTCRMVFNLEQCCRNGSIVSIVPGNFYSEMMMDICLGAQKQADGLWFNSRPIQYLCVNNINTYSQGLANQLSSDDSIVYSFEQPKNDQFNFSTYMPGYDVDHPLKVVNNSNPPGLVFDKLSGSLIIQPIISSEVSIIVIRCDRYSRDLSGNLVLRSTNRREMELFMIDCMPNNSPPYFTGNNRFSICEGNKLCFELEVKDDPFLPNQTVPDTVLVDVLNPIPEMNYYLTDSQAREKTIKFCWQTKEGDARVNPYYTTVFATDDLCSQPGFAYRDFIITVKPKAKAERHYKKLFRGGLELLSVPDSSRGKAFPLQFNIRDSSGNVIHSSYNKSRDTFTFTQTGTYYIEHMVVNSPENCPAIYFDTFFVTAEHLTNLKQMKLIRFNIYPNPGKDVFAVDADMNFSEEVLCNVWSSEGRLMGQRSIKNASLDLSPLPAGVYTLEFESKGVLYHSVVIKN